MAAPILVTGAAGFIGFHAAQALLARGIAVVGIDSFSPYYDPALKKARFARLRAVPGFAGDGLDLTDGVATRALFARHGFRQVLHLAAQPGVRHADPSGGLRGREPDGLRQRARGLPRRRGRAPRLRLVLLRLRRQPEAALRGRRSG